jgi:N-acetylglucosamine-6-phosphate deacetylase
MTIAFNTPGLFDGHRIRRDASLQLEGGSITHVEPARGDLPTLPADHLVAPGLIDIQVNGGGGILFNDRPDALSARQIAQAHARHGTTSILVTLITDAPEKIDQAVDAVRECMNEGTSGIAGIHLEGPFIDTQRRGIHAAQWIQSGQALDPQQLCRLGAAGTTLITLAPEHVPASQIRALRELGAIVFAGHTNCNDQEFNLAIEAGVQGVTHLFNAMSQIGPRQAGVAGTVLVNPQLWAGIILDGHHVGVETFKLVSRMGRLERTVLVSDAMGVAASDLDAFELYGQKIRVLDGRCVNDDNVLAGASVTLSDCVRIGIDRFGLAPEQALASASTQPAELLGLHTRKGHLRVGYDADLVIFDGQFRVAASMQAGRWIYISPHLQSVLSQGIDP